MYGTSGLLVPFQLTIEVHIWKDLIIKYNYIVICILEFYLYMCLFFILFCGCVCGGGVGAAKVN